MNERETVATNGAIAEVLRCRAAIEEHDPRLRVLLRNAANELDGRDKEITRLREAYRTVSEIAEGTVHAE